MNTALERGYRRLLGRYERAARDGSHPLFCRSLEHAVSFAAAVLMRWHRFSFPSRATGGWWWIDRYRFEFLAGWMEQDSLLWCRRLVKPGMTVIDIGAHIGFYTRRLAKMVGPGGRVIAFEANPENFAVLQANLRGYRNVELWNRCVADRDGVFTLHISPGHSNHSLNAGYTASESSLSIPGVALDSFLAARGTAGVGFIKCDTEGAEPQVIEGMAALLKHRPAPALLIEYNPKAMRCGGAEPKDLLDRLESLGYAVRAIGTDGGLVDVPELEGNESCNLLCRPL